MWMSDLLIVLAVVVVVATAAAVVVWLDNRLDRNRPGATARSNGEDGSHPTWWDPSA